MIDLDDVKNNIFALLVQWLHTSELSGYNALAYRDLRMWEELENSRRLCLLVDVTLLSDCLGAPKLTNHVMDVMGEYTLGREMGDIDQAQKIYRNSPPGHPLRRYMALHVASGIEQGSIAIWDLQQLEDGLGKGYDFLWTV